MIFRYLLREILKCVLCALELTFLKKMLVLMPLHRQVSNFFVLLPIKTGLVFENSYARILCASHAYLCVIYFFGIYAFSSFEVFFSKIEKKKANSLRMIFFANFVPSLHVKREKIFFCFLAKESFVIKISIFTAK